MTGDETNPAASMGPASVFMIVAALSLFVFMVFSGDRITQANIDRIQTGTSLEQVCEILGRPTAQVDFPLLLDVTAYEWEGRRADAIVAFRKDDGGVMSKWFYPQQGKWWSQVRHFFGL